MILDELACAVHPLILIEKSPSMVYGLEAMQRAHRFFPEARFIHLVRHPRGYCESVLKYLHMLMRPEYKPRERKVEIGDVPEWIRYLASFPYPSLRKDTHGQADAEIDPQGGWYVLNMNVRTFLKSLPEHQWITVRGEDLLRQPKGTLAQLAEWLGLRADTEAVEQMTHPENSPFARFGPRGARLGNDILFLEHPALRPKGEREQSLQGTLSWRPDGGSFLPEVVELSHHLGYQ